MNQQKPKEGVKTLSIRIPESLYLKVSQFALDSDMPSMNAGIMKLIKDGLEVTQDRDEIIRSFLFEVVPMDKLKDMIDGQS